MNERLKRARRMLAVQSDIERLAAWRLMDSESQGVALTDQRRDLTRRLDADPGLGAAFAAVIIRRLQRIEARRGQLNGEIEAQAGRRLDERRRLRRAQLIVRALELDATRDEGERRLLEAIEAAARRSR